MSAKRLQPLSQNVPEKPRIPYDIEEPQARRLLIGLILLSTLIGCGLAYLKFSSFEHVTGDTSYYGYAFHQTIKGRWFPISVREGSVMGNHPNFLALLILPFFYLVPTIYTLFVAQSFALSLTAWPAYLLGRRVTGNRVTALIAAAAVLLFPPIVAGHVAEIHEDQFGVALCVFAFYFFEAQDFKKFALCMAASLLAKETVFLNTIFFGVYALVRHRSWKWVLFPLGWSTAYLLIVVKVLMPMWGTLGSQIYSQAMYFTDFGQTPGQVLTTMLTKPGLVVSTLLQPDRLVYLLQLLQPILLVLPFRSWSFMVALPNLGVNLLSSNTALRVMGWHYGIVMGGLLWCSLICSLTAWNRTLSSWFGAKDYHRGLCVILLVLGATQYHLWFYPNEYLRNAGHDAEDAAVQMIPQNATVFCPGNMLGHYCDHPKYQSLGGLTFHKRDLNELFDYDYLVFDFNFVESNYRGQQQLFEFISKHPAYRRILERDNVFVFHREGTPERNLR